MFYLFLFFTGLLLTYIKIEEKLATKELLKKVPLLVSKVAFLVVILVIMFYCVCLLIWVEQIILKFLNKENGEKCGFYVLYYMKSFLDCSRKFYHF